jgi:hypothetical protein
MFKKVIKARDEDFEDIIRKDYLNIWRINHLGGK